MPGKKSETSVTFWLPEPLYKKLKLYCAVIGAKMKTVLKEAVKEKLAGGKNGN